MSDLSLIPIHDLVDEIAKRSEYYVIGYNLMDSGEELFHVFFDGAYLKTQGLCTQIIRDIQKDAEKEGGEVE